VRTVVCTERKKAAAALIRRAAGAIPASHGLRRRLFDQAGQLDPDSRSAQAGATLGPLGAPFALLLAALLLQQDAANLATDDPQRLVLDDAAELLTVEAGAAAKLQICDLSSAGEPVYVPAAEAANAPVREH